jgi:hypothetical protein
VTKEAEIKSTELDWSGEPLTSSIKRGTINMKARVKMAVIATDSGVRRVRRGISSLYKILHICNHISVDTFENQSTTCEGICCFDLEPPKPGSIVHCLQVSDNEQEGLSSYHDR